MIAPVECGVDTWRLARYLDDDRELDRARDLMPNGRLPDRIEGHVVGLLPGHRMLWLEGHPAVEGLAPPDTLASVYEGLLEGLGVAGLPTGRDAGVGRLDSTVTVGGYEAGELSVTLLGAAALDVARAKPVVYGKPAQTVYWQGARSRSVLARMYDKALEAAGTPGRLLRFEDQRRFTKETRRAVSELDPRTDFERRFGPLCKSARGVTAASYPALGREFAERVATGEMTYREAERLGGALLIGSAGVRGSGRTMKRRRRELREHGLVLADDFYEPLTVDLGESFEAVMSAW